MAPCDPVSHITDSRFYASGYSTPEAKRVFCDLYRYQRWLDVEAVLAEAQALVGIIPSKAAEDIRSAADIRRMDLEFIKRQLQVTNHSLMPLLSALSKVCPGPSRRFIHFGATTQDIQDTALVLEIRDIVEIIHRDLLLILHRVADLSERYKELVIIGRTHTQDALPMTLGLKMAGWLDELWRNEKRLREMKGRLLVSQLFGGVGTMDAFGHRGIQLLEIFSERLGLLPPFTSWHNSRDRLSEFLNTVSLISGALARIAEEIRSLSRSGIGEMEEPFHMGKLGSSTMPHKRNPEICEQVVVLSKLVKANALLGMEGLVNEHERDYRSVRLEWVTIADSAQFVCAALSFMKHVLKNLIVHEDKIFENVSSAAHLISTEALMFYLGEKIGKDKAHALIYHASMKAAESKGEFLDILFERSEINDSFSKEELRRVLNPEKHTGLSAELSQNIVDLVRKDIASVLDVPERQCPLSDISGRCSVVS